MDYAFSMKKAHFTANLGVDVNCALHIHRQFEIVLAVENSITMQINFDTHRITEGTAVLIAPYEPHSFITKEPNKCLIIEFSPDYYKPFCEWFNTHTKESCEVIMPKAVFDYILTILPKRDVPCTDTEAYALLAPLCQAIIKGGKWKNEPNMRDDVFLNALNIISYEYAQPLSRESVAKRLNVCPQTLSRIFKKNSSLSFVNYVQYIRIYNALRLLKSNESVTDVAYSSGFESIRTFNRVFKSIVGMTPSEYASSDYDEFFNYS